MATKETKLIDKKSIKELVDILDEMELTTFLIKKEIFQFQYQKERPLQL
jgi:hypothetical protein